MATEGDKNLDTLYELIEHIGTAMMTTRRTDGRLVSRPMATQERQPDADLWFVADVESHKIDELVEEPHVNLAFYDSKSREWVSVSGTARVSTDRARIRELWKPDWRIWFGKVDEVRDGGPDDPRLALILVDADSVFYMKKDKPGPVILFEIARALITGKKAEIGEVTKVRMG